MLNSKKNLSQLAARAAVCSFAIAGIFVPSAARAASLVTGFTPSGGAVEPGNYDVFLDAGDPLHIDVTVTVPATPSKLDLFLLEDLSGSFGDDLNVIKTLVPNLVTSITGIVSDTFFGVGSYVDKPISPFGFSGDYVYRTDLALTADTGLLQTTVNGLTIRNGGDFPESQLEALLQTAVRATGEVGFRNDAFKVVVLSTDATYHKAGDFASRPPNDGDAILDGSPEGTGEDYPSIAQVKNALQAANIIPIFAVTTNVISTYEDLVAQLGFGSVVQLSSNSSNLVTAITSGLSDVFRDITLNVEGDDFGYVQSITPGVFTDVPEGDSRTFKVELLADGVDDANDTLSLVAPGFGTTLVNVTVSDTTSVPEPTTMLGLLAFGAVGASTALKRKQKAVATV